MSSKKFGKQRKTSGATVTVGQWVASGFIGTDGEYYGKVRHCSAYYKNSIDMNTADALIEDMAGFIAACEAATGDELEKHYRAQAAKEQATQATPAPIVTASPLASLRKFGK